MRRRRRDASAEEPDVCPCRQGSADQHLLSAAGLGSSDAGELLLLLLRSAAGIHWGGGWIHWIHWGGVPPPKALRSTLGQLEA